MSDEVKDTLESGAGSGSPEATTPQTETPAESPKTTPESAPEGITEKVYAGKFKSAEDLEKGYQELSSKLGKKGYAEQLGEKVVSATGYSVQDLEDAGYSPDQIVDAVISYQDTGKKQELPAKKQEMTQKVESSKLEKLEWKIDVRDFVDKNPEAKEFQDELNDFHSMSQYRDLSPEELFNTKLSKFVKKGEQNVETRQSAKEKASMSLSPSSSPKSGDSDKALKSFKQTRNLDDAADLLMARMAERRKG